MSKAKNGTEVLKAAKWMLEHIGWVQNHHTVKDVLSKPTAFCAVGALDTVEATDYKAVNNAFDRLRALVDYGLIVEFNDAPGRTKQEVLAVFDRAIKTSPKKKGKK